MTHGKQIKTEVARLESDTGCIPQFKKDWSLIWVKIIGTTACGIVWWMQTKNDGKIWQKEALRLIFKYSFLVILCSWKSASTSFLLFEFMLQFLGDWILRVSSSKTCFLHPPSLPPEKNDNWTLVSSLFLEVSYWLILAHTIYVWSTLFSHAEILKPRL